MDPPSSHYTDGLIIYCRSKALKISWVVELSGYGVITMPVARLCYEYQVVHTIYMILLHVWVLYNGASFYMEVFAKKGLQGPKVPANNNFPKVI